MQQHSPRNVHIVVVDDEPLILETACRILEDEGFAVRPADSAEAALDLIDEATVLVLSDTALGGMSGPQLREHLRAERPAVKFVSMSGMERDELGEWGIDPDRDHFLAKPFAPTSLIELVRRVVHQETSAA